MFSTTPGSNYLFILSSSRTHEKVGCCLGHIGPIKKAASATGIMKRFEEAKSRAAKIPTS